MRLPKMPGPAVMRTVSRGAKTRLAVKKSESKKPKANVSNALNYKMPTKLTSGQKISSKNTPNNGRGILLLPGKRQKRK